MVYLHVRGPSTTDLVKGGQELFHRQLGGGRGSGLRNGVEDAGYNLVSECLGLVLTTLVAGDLKKRKGYIVGCPG